VTDLSTSIAAGTLRDQADPAAGAPLLEVENLSVDFPAPNQPGGVVHAVRGINYQVRQGEFLSIVGESGSGKSVSSMAVIGLLPSSARISGSIRFRGQDLLAKDDDAMSRLRGREIAMIFQDPLSALTPVYNIGWQLTEGLKLHDRGLTDRAANARAVELLRIVGIPSPERRMLSFPHEFSGGMRQRVMIAIAIANDPNLIIADEPTTALDVTIQAQILEVLQKAREITGAAVVLITHDLGVVAGNADRVAVMYAGKLVETGTIDDIFYRPAMPYTAGLLRSVPNMQTAGNQRLVPLEGNPPSLANLPPGCPFEPRGPAAIDRCREIEPELAPVPGGRADEQLAACIRSDEIASGRLLISEIFPRPEAQEIKRSRGAEPVIRVENLVRHFPLTKGAVFRRRVGTVKAVDGVSFELAPGEVLGLVGESGCGKSTTVMEVLELAKPQSGRILINGTDVGELSRAGKTSMRKEIQVVFQDPMAAIDPRFTVYDIVAEPMRVHKVPERDKEKKVAEMLELVGLDPATASRYPHEFSGGQRQRIEIARALTTDPKILVLDEPVSALDVSIQAGVINLLEDLRERLSLSYLFVAHDLAVVRQVADKLAVMYLGRIVEYGEAANIFAEPKHPYTKALMSAVPIPDPEVERNRRRILLEGDLPSPVEDFTGCRFAGRCPLYQLVDEDRQKQCRSEDPHLHDAGGSSVACHHTDQHQLVTG
jgi:peptide/nickel transport system ATP-binding protein